ncbi:MAG: hypothetical protein GYA69_00130 [Candidatus Moranbacteria bacterium]|nr:hypothetical protein [Candidatus Moranbacteria bacterium]
MKKLQNILLTVIIGLTLISCGKTTLDETYEGPYFSINHPGSWKVEENPSLTTISGDGVGIMIESVPNEQIKANDVAEIKTYSDQLLKELGGNEDFDLSTEEKEINGQKGVWLLAKSKKEEKGGFMFITAVDKAVLMVGVGAEVEGQEKLDLVKMAIESFKITKPDYFTKKEPEKKDTETTPKTEETKFGQPLVAEKITITPLEGWTSKYEKLTSTITLTNAANRTFSMVILDRQGMKKDDYTKSLREGLKQSADLKVKESTEKIGEIEYDRIDFLTMDGRNAMTDLVGEKNNIMIVIMIQDGLSSDIQKMLETIKTN